MRGTSIGKSYFIQRIAIKYLGAALSTTRTALLINIKVDCVFINKPHTKTQQANHSIFIVYELRTWFICRTSTIHIAQLRKSAMKVVRQAAQL